MPTEPWEQGGIKNFTAPAIPLGDGRWQLWYYAHPVDRKGSVLAVAEGVPGQNMRKTMLHRSAGEAARHGVERSLSNLPDGWQPVQPVYLRLHNGTHRIYFWAHAPGIVRYLYADSLDGLHFVVGDPHRPVLYHYHDRAVENGDLPHGLSIWGGAKEPRPAHEKAASVDLVCNDATNVHVLPDGSFELFTPTLLEVAKDSPQYIREDNAAGFIRVIDRLTSKDGIHFGDRVRVLERNENDPPGLQFYYLSVTRLGAKRLGLIGHYRADRQTLAIERAWSDDGIHWDRHEKVPWLDCGLQGEKDVYAALAPHSLVNDAGQWWCFYTGFNFLHNGQQSVGSALASVLLASLDGITEH